MSKKDKIHFLKTKKCENYDKNIYFFPHYVRIKLYTFMWIIIGCFVEIACYSWWNAEFTYPHKKFYNVDNSVYKLKFGNYFGRGGVSKYGMYDL